MDWEKKSGTVRINPVVFRRESTRKRRKKIEFQDLIGPIMIGTMFLFWIVLPIIDILGGLDLTILILGAGVIMICLIIGGGIFYLLVDKPAPKETPDLPGLQNIYPIEKELKIAQIKQKATEIWKFLNTETSKLWKSH